MNCKGCFWTWMWAAVFTLWASCFYLLTQKTEEYERLEKKHQALQQQYKELTNEK